MFTRFSHAEAHINCDINTCISFTRFTVRSCLTLVSHDIVYMFTNVCSLPNTICLHKLSNAMSESSHEKRTMFEIVDNGQRRTADGRRSMGIL